MMAIDVSVIVLGLVIILFSAIIQGITAFGFALVCMPLLSTLLPLQLVVPIIIILALMSSVMMLINMWSFVKLKKIMPLIISGTIATPLGTYLLQVVDQHLLKIFVGILIVLFAIALWRGFSVKIKNEKIAFIPVGFASGLLNGSLGLNGPPVILFMANQGESKNNFRANLTAFGVFLSLITIAYYTVIGVATKEVVQYSLTFLPALFIGTFLGMIIAKKVNQQLFNKLTFILIILSGLSAVLTAIF